MHINIQYRLGLQLNEFNEIRRRANLAITRFRDRYISQNSQPGSLIFIDRRDDKLFSSLGKHERVIWISERVETVPEKVIVSVPEDVFERTYQALEQIFQQ
jgi:hypothetical protein